MADDIEAVQSMRDLTAKISAYMCDVVCAGDAGENVNKDVRGKGLDVIVRVKEEMDSFSGGAMYEQFYRAKIGSSSDCSKEKSMKSCLNGLNSPLSEKNPDLLLEPCERSLLPMDTNGKYIYSTDPATKRKFQELTKNASNMISKKKIELYGKQRVSNSVLLADLKNQLNDYIEWQRTLSANKAANDLASLKDKQANITIAINAIEWQSIQHTTRYRSIYNALSSRSSTSMSSLMADIRLRSSVYTDSAEQGRRAIRHALDVIDHDARLSMCDMVDRSKRTIEMTARIRSALVQQNKRKMNKKVKLYKMSTNNKN